jgi:methyltransferase
VAANALRWWCIATLGPRWSARVIVLPGEPLVRSGPYRRLAHPNYIAVIIEGAALPLAGSAWITAIGFTVLNAALLTVRIRSESRALAAAAPGAAGTGSAGTGSAGTGSAGAGLASTGPASTGPTG